MTLVLTTNKAQLVLMLLFAHKLRSCWCLHTNLTLPDYKIFLFFFTPPPPQEFSGGDASVPRSSALKRLKAPYRYVLAFTEHHLFPLATVADICTTVVCTDIHVYTTRNSCTCIRDSRQCLQAPLPHPFLTL